MNDAQKIEAVPVVEVPTVEEVDMVKPDMAWLDLETTGLNNRNDVILELGMILTDKFGEEIARNNWVLHFDIDRAHIMPDVVREMHTKSGLLEECNVLHFKADAEIAWEVIQWLQAWGIEEGKMPLSGATIGFDRGFLQNYMPALDRFLHYRSIDVSAFREVARLLNPSIMEYAPEKREVHRALPDIEDSITLYKFLVENFFWVPTDEPERT